MAFVYNSIYINRLLQFYYTALLSGNLIIQAKKILKDFYVFQIIISILCYNHFVKWV